MPRVEFYPLDIDAVDSPNGKTRIRLFGRTPDGKRVCAVDDRFEASFYLVPTKVEYVKKIQQLVETTKQKDGERLAYVTKTKITTKQLLGDTVEAIKVSVNHTRDVKILSRYFKKLPEVKNVHETDLPSTKRYLIEHNLAPLVSCVVEGEEIEADVRADIVVSIEKLDTEGTFIKNPKILGMDIEVYNKQRYPNEQEDPILMVSFYGVDGFSKVITWKPFENAKKYVEFVKDEGEMLLKCKEVIKEYNPDYLVGYYSDGFDLPYLRTRAEKYHIKFNVGMDRKGIRINRVGTLQSARIKGLIHIDVYKFIKRILKQVLQLEEYDLDTVSKTLLGEGKAEENIEGLADAWDNHPEKLKGFCEYNLQDARLVYQLTQKLMPHFNEIAKLIRMPLYELSRMTYGQLVENYILTHLKQSNELILDKPHQDEIQERRKTSYTGGSVHEPKAGLYEDLVVFDFRSLHPSIMSSHNICPSTLTKEGEHTKETPVVKVNDKELKYYFNYKKDGFIPGLVKEIIERRNRIKAMTKETITDPLLKARVHILKLLLNSFYGYLAYPGARWYSLPCAAAISAYGREYVKQVIKQAEREGFKVIYSDTDSIFLSLGKEKTKEDSLRLLRDINHNLPSLMELEYEAFYKRGLFVKKRTTTKGAKKKYALLDKEDTIKIVGFETVRGDWSVLAREVQQKIIEITLKEGTKEKALQYVKQVIQEIKEDKVPLDKMIIKKQLKKEINTYESIGPHVAVAKKLIAQGRVVPVGSVVAFVVCSGEGSIGDRATPPNQCNDYDKEYYINNQIIPATEKILDALGYPAKTVLDEEQSTFGDF